MLESVSRLVGEIVSPQVASAAQRLRAALAVLREKEDLVSIGAYQAGSDPALDVALAHRPRIESFLRQPVHERCDAHETDALLADLADSLAAYEGHGSAPPDAEVLDAGQPARDAAPAFLAGAEAPAIPALGLSL